MRFSGIRLQTLRTAFVYSILLIASSDLLLAAPVGLRVNSLANPLGVDTRTPIFSWRSDDQTRNWMQLSYRVEVATRPDLLASGKPNVWDSGQLQSSESVGILYRGPELSSTKRYFWRVTTWDGAGHRQVSAEHAWWEMGMLGKDAWKARWITHVDPDEGNTLKHIQWIWLPGKDAFHVPGRQTAEFRYRLHLDSQLEAAVLHCLTGGSFVAEVNGKRTGGKSEWGAFDREDIRDQLHIGSGEHGDNEIVIRTVARGARAPETVTNGFAAVLDLRDSHLSVRHIVTDGSWTTRESAGAPWQRAETVGPLSSLKVSVGSDRQELESAPDRISTEVSLLRKVFNVQSKVDSARLYITALGSYRASINGVRVGESELTPGFTDFRKRVLYQTYDVTSQLQQGRNVVGVKLAGGWHGSPLLWSGVREFGGPDLLLAQLVITLRNGTKQVIGTDNSWAGANDATSSSEIYGGESYDARFAQSGWDAPRFIQSGSWTPVQEQSLQNNFVLAAQPDSSPHVSQTLTPIKVSSIVSANAPAGSKLFDMGQNMVGVVRLRVNGQRGSTIKMRFAERLQPDGSVYTDNLRNADAIDEYTLRGGGPEEWTPSFTFHGFRYVQVEGLTNAGHDVLEGIVINSLPKQPSMRFESSNPLLNHMFELGLWGQRGNFVSVPTDCPQRDERMGWMGDAGVFWRTGTYNFDIDAFSHKFMDDVVDAQTRGGVFANISPNLLLVGPEEVGAPGWGDAGVLVPYSTWMQYGDRNIIDQNWDAMERWMRFIETKNADGLRRNDLGPNYADWLAPDPHTPQDLVATAYWALIAQQMQIMAQATGRMDAATRYGALYDKIRGAYMKTYVQSDGRVQGDTQTGYVLTLYAGLFQPQDQKALADHLVADIKKNGNHLTTGFLGTPFLLFVLDAEGRSDVAFQLLLSDTYPSWGYMVSKGATTWWERWNGDTGDPGMNSYNHYAFGSVMAWVYRRVSGIDTDATGPGFHHLVIAPHTDAKLTHVHSEYDSAYGTVVTEWNRNADGELALRVNLPANTSATVKLPEGPHGSVLRDGKPIGNHEVEIGSGETRFVVH